jgi:RNA polymerase sigma-70 factor (ECF subfamily)
MKELDDDCTIATATPPPERSSIRDERRSGSRMQSFGIQSLRRIARRTRSQHVHESDVDHVYDLVEAARDRDRLAMAALYDCFHSVVYRTLRARVVNREDTEDLVAETFLEVWNALPNYQWTGAPFAAWILTISTSRANMHVRRAASRPVSDESGSDALDRLLDGHDDYARSDQRAEALSLLETLPDEQRTVLTLRFYGGMSAEEIAVMLGKRPGAVRQMQMVALERLGRQRRREHAA